MIRDKLESLQDLKYREFSLKLLPSDTNIIGVRLPILRKLSKSITKEELSDDTFEEIMLQGMIIGRIEDFSEFQKACLSFLPKINNWSICDSFVSSLKITQKYPTEMLSFLENLSCSSFEYTRRFVLVMLLRYYLSPFYYKKVTEILRTISKEEYYVKMAIAWLLAALYIKNKTLSLAILKDSTYNLDKFTINKTISKIKDSKQISIESKKSLENLKK